jgi:dTDP-4-dehydrorhamnose 3,5-epimerase
MTPPRTVVATSIKGIYVIYPHKFEDFRGIFREAFTMKVLKEAVGRELHFRAWNHSRSYPRVIRGIHAEDTCKLIYPINGHVFIAAVDLRPESETFGQHLTFEMSDETPFAIFIEEGIGIGYCPIGDKAVDYLYVMTNEYDELKPKGVLYNDPDIGIKWPVTEPVISDRDKSNPSLRELFPEKFK